MVSSTRNPLYLALEWATLDQLSGGRTILGTGIGNPEQGVQREFEALGLDFKRRASIFEEGLRAIRALWTEGKVTLDGEFFHYDDVAFYSGTEMAPLGPVQKPPPIWVVSQPAPRARAAARRGTAERMERACRRIVELRRRLDDLLPRPASRGARRAARPCSREVAADRTAATATDYTVSYQVTMNIGDSEEEAPPRVRRVHLEVLPGAAPGRWISRTGARSARPTQIAEWIRTFADAGVDHFICRFGAHRPVRPGRALRRRGPAHCSAQNE